MLKLLDSILWAIATVFILYSGIYYTIKLKFVQFRFIKMFKNIFQKKYKKNAITPFQSLMMVLGGRIGVGSIAGIALSIYLGGVGTVFWVWVTGIISAPNTFAETILGVRYKEIDEKNVYKGGPSYYLKKGLNKHNLGIFYAIVMVVSQIFGFLSIQSNTITKSLKPYININSFLIGMIISIISFFIINGGVKKISKVSSKLVPIMTLIYVISAMIIILLNIHMVPKIFVDIITSAFNFKSFGIGVVGSMIIGIQRGIFSNEAGLGTGAIAASTVDVDFPAEQGYIQMIGIYITTFLVCTATALVIMIAGTKIDGLNINGIEITLAAFNFHLGNLGNIIVIISIILFAFSTILSCYYDGESNFKYLVKKHDKKLLILKITSCIIILFGSVMSSSLLWQIINIFTAVLAIINIYALMKLKKDVIFEWKRYK